MTTRLLSGLLALLALALVAGLFLLLRTPGSLPAAGTLVVPPAAAQPPPDAMAAGVPVKPVAAVAVPSPSPRAVGIADGAAHVPAARLPVTDAPHRSKPAQRAATEAIQPPPIPTQLPTTIETGRLNLDTTPWSTVSLGGRVLGQTPLVGVSLPVGTHTLVLSNPEQGLKTTYQVTISAGRTTARRVGLD